MLVSAQASLLARRSLPHYLYVHRESKMSRRTATFLVVATLLLVRSHARFTDTGVPCYLRPSGDRCHYRAKPDSPTCTSADDRRRLAEGARQLNRSIAVLEQKLIRLGVSKWIINDKESDK